MPTARVLTILHPSIVAATLMSWPVQQGRADDPAKAPAEKTPSVIALPDHPKPMVLARPIEAVMAERIARKIIEASPLADPGDTQARDAAAEKLAACDDLISAADGRIVWGGFNPQQGYDPQDYRLTETSRDDLFQLTEFEPVVWAKLYLSTFMFTGKSEVRQEGRFTVLELEAKFRGSMDPGEYPYPFWHSPNKWTAYMNVESMLLVFERKRLVAAMRKSPPPLSVALIKKPWDGKWEWSDSSGRPQPRVTLFSYLFSASNPFVADLDQCYRALATELRAQNCMICHQPDNRGRINDLLLLNYPNQALVSRRSLVSVLEDNQMPPGNALANEKTGIQEPEDLKRLLELARAFEQKADQAFAFESSQAVKAAPAKAEPSSP